MGINNLIEIKIYLNCQFCKTEQLHRIYKKRIVNDAIFELKCVKCKKEILRVSNIFSDSIVDIQFMKEEK